LSFEHPPKPCAASVFTITARTLNVEEGLKLCAVLRLSQCKSVRRHAQSITANGLIISTHKLAELAKPDYAKILEL
jgi:hypothetical protein